MSTLKVRTEMTIYEVDGKDTEGLHRPQLEVLSHWNRSELVVLHFEGAPAVTVSASELDRAIQAARRAHR